MRNEEYKPLAREDRTRRMERPPVAKTAGNKTYLQKIKPIRPDAPGTTAAKKKPAAGTKKSAASKPLPRGSRSDTPAMDALIRKTEAEELRKRREAEKRRQEAEKRHRQVGVGTAKSRTNQVGKSPNGHPSQRMDAKQGASGEKPGASRMMISVASVAFLLLILWFAASFFIDAMSDHTVGDVRESSSIQESDTEAPQESSAAQSSDAAQSSAAEESIKPLTEGDADYQKPDTWIGKTFLVEDDANVRSDGGTQNSILFTVNPGEKFIVKQAKMVDDAAWVQGIAVKKDGTKQEGWIYSYCLGNKPQ